MKKLLSLLLVLSLVFTSSAVAFADEADSKGLENAIKTVKNVITIPSDYKDFQYSTSEYEENGNNISAWYLNWSKSDYSAGISATVEEGGYLISYNQYTSDEKEGLGTVTKEQATKTANAFVSKARPDIASQLKLTETNVVANTYSHTFNYKLYKNNVAVDFAYLVIEVDKFTGKVSYFSYQGSAEDFTKLPSTSGEIGIEAAKKAYLEKIGVSLGYYSYYDYNKKLLKVFPAYGANYPGTKAIDAKTGQAVSLYNMYYGGMGSGMGEMSKNQDAGVAENQLTKEEMDAVEKISGIISKEKAESIIRSTIPGFSSKMEMTNASLTKNTIEPDKYSWGIGFDGGYGVVNAITGELTSFYLYSEESYTGSLNITEAKAKEKAESFIKTVAAEKFAASKFYENPYYSNLYKNEENVTEYSFNYYRQANGVNFFGNSFSITVNKATGMITQYDCNWYDNVKFPVIEKAITSGAAFDMINKTGNLKLSYKKVNDGETALVYDFEKAVSDFLIDPFTGVKLGWDGNSYKEASTPKYTDIKGNWAEATINKLIENGYYIEGEKFNPKTQITQIGFLRYLYSPIQNYYNDEDFYNMLISSKIIKESEKSANSVVTRQDAARFAVRYLGQSKTAEHPEIFINPFKDKINNSYKGYAAISYGLGIMKGDTKGRFNGTKNVTNAEAAVIIYNTLNVK